MAEASVMLGRVQLTVRVLGTVSAERGNVHVALAPTLRVLLGVLASESGARVSASRLTDALWGENAPTASSATLQSHLSRLRRLLAPEATIEARDGGYRLVMSDGVIDAEAFARTVLDARAASQPSDASRIYASALAWWRGPAFGDLAEHDHLRSESIRLEEHRNTATEDWIDSRLASGADAGLVGDLEALTTAHPLRERYWRQLMVALYRTSRQAEALRRAAEMRVRLRDEMGLDVSAAMRELEARILADDPTLMSPSPASPRLRLVTADDPSPLVGRDEDLRTLSRSVLDRRLVTLVGPGGVGKSRVARRIAATAEGFDDGACVIELAGFRDPIALVEFIATALDVQQRQQLTVDETLLLALAARHQLLVLDNCEHVLDVVVPFVDRIRTRCHGIHVLATSREPLGLPAEVIWPIMPLAVAEPDVDDLDEIAEGPAVQLLVERATAALPGFVLTARNTRVVAELCRRLDGLPLALELAAARFRSLSPETILERLGGSARLLDAGPRAPDARHRTLRDTIGWSYELLTAAERTLFCQLAVFAGTFDLDAVEAVCGSFDQNIADAVDPPEILDVIDVLGVVEVLDVLVALVDKSMVQMITSADHKSSRYQLLETLREFGLERLEESGGAEVIRDNHLRWYASLAGRAEDGLVGEDEAAWSRRIAADFDNYRAAHNRAVRMGNVDAALRLVAGLREFAFRRIRYELLSWAHTASELTGASSHPLFPVVLATVAYGNFVRGDLEAAIDVAHRVVTLQERSSIASSGLAERALGNALFYLGRTDEALAWMDRMVAAARTSDSPARLAHALYMRSVAETSVGRTVRGAVLAGEARAAAHASGSPTARAQAEYALGLALEGTEPVESVRLFRVAAETAAAAGNRWIEAFAQTEVWWLEARTGDIRRALAGSGAVIDTWHRGGDWANLWFSMRRVAGILQRTGDHRAAAVVHGAIAAAGVTDALPFEPGDAEQMSELLAQLREILGPDVFDRSTGEGAALSEPGLVTFVQERIASLTDAVGADPTG